MKDTAAGGVTKLVNQHIFESMMKTLSVELSVHMITVRKEFTDSEKRSSSWNGWTCWTNWGSWKTWGTWIFRDEHRDAWSHGNACNGSTSKS